MQTWKLILSFKDNSIESHEFCLRKIDDLGEQINYHIAAHDTFASKIHGIFAMPTLAALEEVKDIIEEARPYPEPADIYPEDRPYP